MIRLLVLLVPLSLIPFVLSHPALPTSLHAAGQTMESCRQDSDCLTLRTCVRTKSRTPCAGGASCICVPPAALSPCLNSRHCERGELCSAGLPRVSYNCVSARVVASTPQLREVNANTDKPNASNDGLTMDQCRTDLQCRGGRRCSLNEPVRAARCDRDAASCVCTPPGGPRSCTATKQCLKQEVCVSGVVNSGSVCISRAIANEQNDYKRIDPPGASSGLTFDSCRANADCKPMGFAPRWCIGTDNKFCEEATARCVCRPFDNLRFCGKDNDCPKGEVCAKGTVFGTLHEGKCMSSQFVNSEDSVEKYEGTGKGGTMLPCFKTGGCESDKVCADTGSFSSRTFTKCTSTSFACLCAPKSGFVFCESSTKCSAGEHCSTNPFTKPICVSQLAIDDENTAFEKVVARRKARA